MHAIKHFNLICKHKWFVFKNCCRAGLIWRGFMHDMSKFHPTEFWESARYYQGSRSPIDACKEANGYSKAWMHHKAHNKHHFEYWIDGLDDGGKPVQMPFKYALELVCDYLGAARAYNGKSFTPHQQLEWWIKRRQKKLMMHPQTRHFIDDMFWHLGHKNNYDALNKTFAKGIYEIAALEVKQGIPSMIDLEAQKNEKTSNIH